MTTSPNSKQLDSYSMMIASKYFESKKDFINMICVNSKFKDTLDKFHFNPIPVENTQLFPNTETQYLYNDKDIVINNVEHHIVWFPVSYEHQQFERNKGSNFIFKYVSYTLSKTTNNITTIPHDCNILKENLSFYIPNTDTLINIPTNITLLNNNCFGFFEKLETIKLPTSLRVLPFQCFNRCSSLKNIDISHITSIGNNCFINCKSLSSITITKHIENIGKNCFSNCDSLNDIEIKEDVKELLINVDYNISVILKQKNIECKNIFYTRENVNKYGIKIPNVCNKLDDFCYSYQSSLKQFEIPTSITSIEHHCFYYCNSLTSITLTSNLKRIGEGCFQYCSLTSLSQFKQIDKILPNMTLNTSVNELDISNQFTSIKSSSFIKYLHLKKINISNVCKTIGNNCFSGCSQVTSIKLPTSLKTLSNGCFQQCSSLKSIIIPTKVTRIGKACFSSCTSLQEITIPESIKIIGSKCFFDCVSLSSIEFPNSLISIGKNCLKKCRLLQSITISSKVQLTESIGDSKLNINIKEQ